MKKPDDLLMAKLNQLSPAQREALLKKLKQQKPEKNSRQPLLDSPIAACDRTATDYPLSFAQQRLWFLEQLNPHSAIYNIAAAIELNGPLDSHILQQSFQRLIQRHESLRTVFIDTANGARQKILPRLDWQMAVIPLTGEQLPAAIHEDANRGFDLACGPLLRVRLYLLGNERAALSIVMHHIISDAWSSQLLLAEVSRIYTALAQKTALALPPLKIHYLDYSAWQQDWLAQPHSRQQMDYWLQRLEGVANLNLAGDFPRPSIMQNRGSCHRLQLDADLLQALQALCRQHKSSLFHGLLAGFECLLYRYTRQTDFCIGTPVAGRIHPDLEPLIGFFVNTLALPCDIRDGDSFTGLLRKIRKSTLEAQDNQDIPFEQLVDKLELPRDSSYSPVFQAFFSYNPGAIEQQIQLPGITARLIEADTDTAKFDLSLIVSDHDNGLCCLFEYNSELFLPATIEQLAQHFHNLLQAICQQPDADINQLAMLDGDEQRRLLRAQNPHDDYPRTDIASWLEQQAAASAGQTAVVQGQRSLTYRELNQQANRLAHYLQAQGVQQGDFVGLCFAPSMELAVALVATIKLGAVYVPLDPTYPVERLDYMIDNAGIRVLLYSERHRVAGLNAQRPVCLEQLALDGLPDSNPQRQLTPDDSLYIIYTSGSTGLPKAALISHQSEANLLQWYGREFAMGRDDRVLVFSAIGFDLTQKNLLAPLCHGARLHFCDTEYYEPAALLDCIASQQISWINCAPSAFYPLLDSARFSDLRSLRKLFFGGEPIRMDKLADWAASPDFHASITNMYGPTECTDIATSHTIDQPLKAGETVPIGRPCANVFTYVLDEQLNLLPQGAIGELFIGGIGVGKGYLNNPQLTAERFLANPFRRDERMYRSGDLVRLNRHGELEFVSRLDEQLKIRGLRIEPGEIEARLRQLDGIDDAVVTVREIAGQPQLVAYACTDAASWAPQHYRKTLQRQLPDYMVPVAFCRLDSIPLTPNGKLDQKRLPAVDSSHISRSSDYVAPRTDCEKQLAAIWHEVLGIDPVGIDDSFFELGGNSLLATRVISRIREAFAVELPLRTLFEVNTIEGLAGILQATGQPADQGNDQDDSFEEGLL
ncbi:MAG TPA: amino acid adenylation domain-containing protein [Pseudomonadales bacterium]